MSTSTKTEIIYERREKIVHGLCLLLEDRLDVLEIASQITPEIHNESHRYIGAVRTVEGYLTPHQIESFMKRYNQIINDFNKRKQAKR